MGHLGRCGSCGGPRARKDGTMFSTVKDAETFISLVDNGATVKSFERKLMLTKEQIDFHVSKIRTYRRTVLAFEKMKETVEAVQSKKISIKQYNKIMVSLRSFMWTDGELDEIQNTGKDGRWS